MPQEGAQQLLTELLITPRHVNLPSTLGTSKDQKELGSEIRKLWVQILTLLLTNTVIPGKVPNVSDILLPEL